MSKKRFIVGLVLFLVILSIFAVAENECTFWCKFDHFLFGDPARKALVGEASTDSTFLPHYVTMADGTVWSVQRCAVCDRGVIQYSRYKDGKWESSSGWIVSSSEVVLNNYLETITTEDGNTYSFLHDGLGVVYQYSNSEEATSNREWDSDVWKRVTDPYANNNPPINVPPAPAAEAPVTEEKSSEQTPLPVAPEAESGADGTPNPEKFYQEQINDQVVAVTKAQSAVTDAKDELQAMQDQLDQKKKAETPDRRAIANLEDKIKVKQKEIKNKNAKLDQEKKKAEEELKRIDKEGTKFIDDDRKKIGKAAYDSFQEAEKEEKLAEQEYNDAQRAYSTAHEKAEQAKTLTKDIATKNEKELEQIARAIDADIPSDKTNYEEVLRTNIAEQEQELEADEENKKEVFEGADGNGGKKAEYKSAQQAKQNAQLRFDLTASAVGTKWTLTGGQNAYLVFSWLTQTPRFPAISNAIFGNEDWFRKWRNDVERNFVSRHLNAEYYVTGYCEHHFDFGPGEISDSAYIDCGPMCQQFIGSIQAERTQYLSEIIFCDTETPCPQEGWECRDNLCYSSATAKEPEKGYLYKITWSVTAPTDSSFTKRDNEARDEVDFNLRIENENGKKTWLFKDPDSGYGDANTNHLGLGNNSRSLGLPPMILEINPNIYTRICIVFGENRPEDRFGDAVSDICTDIESSTAGTLNTGAVDSEGNPLRTTSTAGEYCGFEGKC